MPDVINNFASLATDAPNVYITQQMYTLSERNLAVSQFAREEVLPNYLSKTMRLIRYRRLNLPTTPLIEGVPPESVGMVLDNIDVTTEQWGIVVLLTDVLQLTVNHPVLEIAMDRTSLAISELVERETGKVLLTATNTVFAGTGNTSRADLLATDLFNNALVLQITNQLRVRGGVAFEGGLYGGVLQPWHESDLLGSDVTFQNASNFARVRKLEYAEIGIWQGVQWVRGNFMPFFQGTPAPTGTAATLNKAQVTVSDSGGFLIAGDYTIATVGREIISDYERRVSQNSALLTVTTGATGSITVITPTSTNYSYDIYLSQPGSATLNKVRSRVAANTPVILTTAPTGTEPVKPVAPANGVSTYPGWVFAKDAFVRVKLNQMSMQSYVTPAGSSWSNPLAQGRKVGTKFMFRVAKLDDNFMVMFETGSSQPDYLPA